MRKLMLCLLLVGWLLAGCQLDDGEMALTETAVPSPTPSIGVAFATRAAPTVAVLQTTPTPLPTLPPRQPHAHHLPD
ncbi:MAG: hypothetical protein IPJ90_03225 [Anaerolineaceae bacterium]|nr:hypothetical protein [Anaerolineaceae bacterium]